MQFPMLQWNFQKSEHFWWTLFICELGLKKVLNNTRFVSLCRFKKRLHSLLSSEFEENEEAKKNVFKYYFEFFKNSLKTF